MEADIKKIYRQVIFQCSGFNANLLEKTLPPSLRNFGEFFYFLRFFFKKGSKKGGGLPFYRKHHYSKVNI